ncbi:MAG: hypothetical protein LH465_08735, partial [Sphingomonas bacterium]|nr:hypothetical protein [Sphingomonas bacterium]
RKSKGGLKVRGVATSSAYANQGYGGQYGNQGYGNPYGNQGYGNPYGNQGYGNQYGANARADLAFSCNVTIRGQVTDVRISRNQDAYRRGY